MAITEFTTDELRYHHEKEFVGYNVEKLNTCFNPLETDVLLTNYTTISNKETFDISK